MDIITKEQEKDENNKIEKQKVEFYERKINSPTVSVACKFLDMLIKRKRGK